MDRLPDPWSLVVSVEVVTVMSRWPDPVRESYYKPGVFFSSLERLGTKPTVLGLNEPWGGLMTKPRRLREWLRAGNCKSETLIVCDAFDIVFTRPAQEVAEVYRREWPGLPVLFNAERALFPRGELAYAFEDVPGPWRYLNSGFMIGEPGQILAMLEAMWLDDIASDHKGTSSLDGGAGTWVNPNDQGHYQYAYAAQPVTMRLDHACVLCQTLSGCSLTDFDLSGDRLRNIEKDTHPMVFHANGGSKDILLPAFLRKWGIE